MAVTDVLTLDEFVDLYKILEMPEAATETELRERVNKLYLEAQRNLDHHNFRKRFYYQQLYEVHLPQAHQLLLNATQRSEYDRYLECFHKGLPFPTDGSQAGAGPTSGDLGRADQIATDMLPTSNAPAASAPAAPPKPNPSFPSETATPSSAPTPARPAAPASRPARPAPPPEPTLAPGETAPSLAAQVAKRKAQVLMDASEVERRRDYKRRELIKRELTAAGQSWGIGAGTVTFVIVAALTFFLSHNNITVLAGGMLTAAVVAMVTGRYALREARRRIVVVLSKMPYDELLRRCAK